MELHKWNINSGCLDVNGEEIMYNDRLEMIWEGINVGEVSIKKCGGEFNIWCKNIGYYFSLENACNRDDVIITIIK